MRESDWHSGNRYKKKRKKEKTTPKIDVMMMCRTVWPGEGTVGDLKIYFILHDDVLHCSSEKKKSQHRLKRWTRKKKHEKFPTGRESSRDDGRGKKRWEQFTSACERESHTHTKSV
jgi:hypothetical protein